LAIRGRIRPRELNNLVGRDMEEESLQEQEGALVEGRSQDDENGAVLEDNIGDVDTEEEEEGAVTVLKLSNGVMIRVPGQSLRTSGIRRVP
jgi:hypothetical protein